MDRSDINIEHKNLQNNLRMLMLCSQATGVIRDEGLHIKKHFS